MDSFDNKVGKMKRFYNLKIALIVIFLLIPSTLVLSQDKGIYKVTFTAKYVDYGEWSPDSKQIAVATVLGKILIWNLTSYASEIPLDLEVALSPISDSYEGLVSSIAWSQNGKFLAVAVQIEPSHDLETVRKAE